MENECAASRRPTNKSGREVQIRGHVFLCILAYYVEWHMRQKLKPMLFDVE